MLIANTIGNAWLIFYVTLDVSNTSLFFLHLSARSHFPSCYCWPGEGICLGSVTSELCIFSKLSLLVRARSRLHAFRSLRTFLKLRIRSIISSLIAAHAQIPWSLMLNAQITERKSNNFTFLVRGWNASDPCHSSPRNCFLVSRLLVLCRDAHSPASRAVFKTPRQDLALQNA